MGGTYCSNAVSVTAANAVLDVFEQEKVLSVAQARHREILGHLDKIRERTPPGFIREIRGAGLMIGIVVTLNETTRLIMFGFGV